MRKLALGPLLVLALACSDSSVLQPDDDFSISAAAAPRMVLTWQETLDLGDWGEQSLTPGGVLQLRNFDFGYSVAGDLVGYNHVMGRAMIDTKTGQGNGSGPAHLDLTSPGVGTLECTWHSKIYDYPVILQYGEGSCEGTGYYEGWKMKFTGSNENNPGLAIYDYTAEVR
jgi:hypothetical protein